MPLTSKYHKCRIDFGNEIRDSIYNQLMLSLEAIIKAYSSLDEVLLKEDFEKISKDMEMCNQISNRYKSLKEHTYGKPHQITTISKNRIIKPINKLDPIRKLTVSNEVMDKIDEAIIKLFTK